MSLRPLPSPSPLATHWRLDPEVVFLNHGAFGACLRVVGEAQSALRDRIEADPVRFFRRDYPPLLERARAALGAFVGSSPDHLARVANATVGVNTVLRSLDLGPDDELLVTDHEYNASRNALDFVARRSGARVVVAELPWPVPSAEALVAAIVERVTPATRLALVDHVTSPTGLVLPLSTIVRELDRVGVDTLVDGAHAPGMLPLALDELGSAYYTGNGHKWLCAPKGCAFLHVRPDRQEAIRPLAISHGANAPRGEGVSRFRVEFDWTGTSDPTPWLVLPEALESLGALDPEGIDGVRRANRSLALAAREILAESLGGAIPCPASMIGSLAALPLPAEAGDDGPPDPFRADPLQSALLEKYRIEVPIGSWPRPMGRLVRISAHRYNDIEQYRYLAGALRDLLRETRG